MEKTTAPTSKTPSPHGQNQTPMEGGTAAKSPSSVFIVMALDMSWRLAIVVLVPIIGGFEIDKHWNTAPVFSIVGFALAMAGMSFVLWRTLQTAKRQPVPKLTAAQKLAIKKQDEEDDE